MSTGRPGDFFCLGGVDEGRGFWVRVGRVPQCPLRHGCTVPPQMGSPQKPSEAGSVGRGGTAAHRRFGLWPNRRLWRHVPTTREAFGCVLGWKLFVGTDVLGCPERPATTAASRAPAKRGSAADGWGRVTGFCPMTEGQDPRNPPPILRRWGCRGKSTCIFPRPGFFWFVFLPAKKMNIAPLRRASHATSPKGRGNDLSVMACSLEGRRLLVRTGLGNWIVAAWRIWEARKCREKRDTPGGRISFLG